MRDERGVGIRGIRGIRGMIILFQGELERRTTFQKLTFFDGMGLAFRVEYSPVYRS